MKDSENRVNLYVFVSVCVICIQAQLAISLATNLFMLARFHLWF